VHLTIATPELEADIGVSGTKEGVEAGSGFFGVGSSRRTRTAGLSGSNRRCFLEEIWTGVESPFSSSSSERRIGWGILGTGGGNVWKRIGGESGFSGGGSGGPGGFFFLLLPLLRISAGWLGQGGMFGNEDRLCLVRRVKISCPDQRRTLSRHYDLWENASSFFFFFFGGGGGGEREK
jgi:hypothetical protein